MIAEIYLVKNPYTKEVLRGFKSRELAEQEVKMMYILLGIEGLEIGNNIQTIRLDMEEREEEELTDFSLPDPEEIPELRDKIVYSYKESDKDVEF